MTKNICVFAGSSSGRREVYGQAARKLGEVIASKGYGLVYGGASVGLMNEAAEGALSQGGKCYDDSLFVGIGLFYRRMLL